MFRNKASPITLFEFVAMIVLLLAITAPPSTDCAVGAGKDLVLVADYSGTSAWENRLAVTTVTRSPYVGRDGPWIETKVLAADSIDRIGILAANTYNNTTYINDNEHTYACSLDLITAQRAVPIISNRPGYHLRC